MSQVKDAFSYVFIWHSFMDARACLKCVALNGREYRDQDIFAPVLVDPQFGPIWDLDANRSLMHGGSGTCRCTLEVQTFFDWNKLPSIQDLKSGLRESGVNVY